MAENFEISPVTGWYSSLLCNGICERYEHKLCQRKGDEGWKRDERR